MERCILTDGIYTIYEVYSPVLCNDFLKYSMNIKLFKWFLSREYHIIKHHAS